MTKACLWGAVFLLLPFAPIPLTGAQTCVEPPAGLVSWWPGDGEASDVVGGNDGTLQGGVSFTPGKVRQAFVFDGIDAFVHIGNPENLKVSTGITLAAWVNPHALPPPDDGTLSGIFAIVTKWGQSTIADSYGIWLHNPDGNIRLVGAIGVAGVGDGGLRNGGILPIGQWSYVAMTYEGTTGLNRLYVNGVQVAERVRGGGINVSDQNVLIGKEDSPLPRFFKGAIDEVEIYNRPLSAAEIQDIFNAWSAGKCLPDDRDRDGIPDNEDNCPGSDLTPTVVIDGCDSEVTNTVFPSGCTLADLLADCADNARKHHRFVHCVARLTGTMKQIGIITGQQKDAMQSCATQADLP
jgi:hypothetical protein